MYTQTILTLCNIIQYTDATMFCASLINSTSPMENLLFHENIFLTFSLHSSEMSLLLSRISANKMHTQNEDMGMK